MSEPESRTILPLEKEKLLLLILGLFVLFIPSSARAMVYAGSVNKYFDIIYIAGGSFLFLVYALRRQINPGVAILTFCFWSMAFMSNIEGKQNLFNQGVTFFNMSLPLLFVGLKLKPDVIQPVFARLLKIMNVLMIITVFIGIVDMVSGSMVTQYMVDNIYKDPLETLARNTLADGVYRFNFIFGYSLTLAWFFLLFFVLNVLHNRHNRPLLPTLWVSLVTIAGLVLCNSRSALIIGALMILFLNGDPRRRWLYPAIVIMLLAAIAFVPIIRDSVAERFIIEMNSSSVSGGRNEALLLVYQGWAKPPGIILGNGLGYSRQVTYNLGGFIKSFEYPVLMFAYDFSMAATVIVYFIILVIPLVKFAMEKQWLKTGLFLALSIYINGFNMLVDGADGLVQFCFAIMLLMHIDNEESSALPPILEGEKGEMSFETNSNC